MKVSTRQIVEFKSIDDVYDELIKLYDESKDKGFQLGEALYTQVPFFSEMTWFIKRNIQDRIKEYLYCKNFNTPMYPSMQETPIYIIEDFTIIEEEHSAYMKYKQEQADNKEK